MGSPQALNIHPYEGCMNILINEEEVKKGNYLT
jgi:CTP-dependent riboflavin kinase